MQKVLAEFKRYLGNVWIDLDQAREAEGRGFVDALLGSEPCRLSDDFGAALYRHTGGHPLFTVELLRHMQEQGVLVRDEEGRWIEGAPLNWDVLPAQAEGVIEERIARLEEELRQTLTVASVEGESFTAQVVARVQEIGERTLVHRLARELDRQHRLVQEQGVAQVHAQRLSLYRFRHSLFQSYLYNELSQAERACLHEDVGYVLEALYGDQADEIAVQLARHFEEAGVTEKARHYLQQAGEQACRRYAYDEAVAYLTRALDLTPKEEHTTRYALLLAREQAYETQGERDAQCADLRALEELAEILDEDGRRAEAVLRQAQYAEATSDFVASIVAAQRLVELALKVDDLPAADRLVAEAYLIWGAALWRQSQYDSARARLEQALPLFRQISAVQQMARVHRALGNVHLYQGQFAGALNCYRQALSLSRACGDRRGQGVALNNLAITFGSLGQYDQTAAHLRQALDITREVGDRRSEASMLVNLGVLSSILGQHEQAKQYDEAALQITQEIEDRQGEGLAQRNLGYSFYDLGELARARTCQERGLTIAREVGDRRGEAGALSYLGETAYALGECAQAEACFLQSLAVRRELGMEHCAAEAQAWLAQVALAEGDLGRARAHVAELLPYLDRDPAMDEGEIVLRVLLVCARVLRAEADPRAALLLDQAHRLLQEQAGKIRDQALRRSFLENVALHREIVTEFARAVSGRATRDCVGTG
jgi:predicted ATPase